MLRSGNEENIAEDGGRASIRGGGAGGDGVRDREVFLRRERRRIGGHGGAAAERVGGAAVVHNRILQGPCGVSKEKVAEAGGEDVQRGVWEEQEQRRVEGDDSGGELFEYQGHVGLFDGDRGQQDQEQERRVRQEVFWD